MRRTPLANGDQTARAATRAATRGARTGATTTPVATQLIAASLAVAMSYGCAANAAAPLTPVDAPSPGAVAAPETAAERELTALGPAGFVSESTLADELSKASLVCLGEQHDNVVHHAQQRRLASALATRARAAGRPIALGLEMFSLPTQPSLDAFTRGEIDEATLLEQTDYARRWGFDFGFYRDTLHVFASRQAPLLALNAPREWTKAVAKAGPSALSELGAELRAEDLVLDDPEHQRFFSAAMGEFHRSSHASTSPNDSSQHPFYAAQVVWDETMAKTAAQWIAEHPDGLLVVLAGAGHCHRSAIPRRFERRLPHARARGVRLSDTPALGEPSIPANWAFDWVTVPGAREPR